MANDIGWGSGAANNSIGWGQGKTNNSIDWGEIYDSSPSGETDLVGVIRPSILTSPVISGSGVVGQTLSTTDGTWSGTLPITFTYQWNRNGSVILGATNNTYTLVTADASTSIDCTVTATNAGGSLSKNSNAISVAAAGDADANAFIAAAAITDTTQKAAIETLVIDLKGYGIWTKMKAIYPFIGGTAAQHKFNLRSPLDTDAAFRLVFNGGWTHSSTGSTPNGVNAFADTFLTPSISLAQNSTHLSYYSRSNVLNTGQLDMGVFPLPTGGAGASCFGISQAVGPAGHFRNRVSTSTASNTYIPTNTLGLFVSNRSISTQQKVYKNGVLQETANINSNGISNLNISIGATRFESTVNSDFSTKQTAFNSIGDGLTDTEAANYYTAVQTFQTTLSRNV